MRTAWIGVCCLLAACAPQFTETFLDPDAPLPVNEARFTEFPDLLHMAFRESCQGPADSYAATGQNKAQCQTVPSPDVAAGLLLRYDGALDVPYIVLERQTRAVDNGFVVGISYFASVPKRSGADQRIYLRSRNLDQTIADLFRAFGGDPIPRP